MAQEKLNIIKLLLSGEEITIENMQEVKAVLDDNDLPNQSNIETFKHIFELVNEKVKDLEVKKELLNEIVKKSLTDQDQQELANLGLLTKIVKHQPTVNDEQSLQPETTITEDMQELLNTLQNYGNIMASKGLGFIQQMKESFSNQPETGESQTISEYNLYY